MNDKIKNAFSEIRADAALKAKTAAYLQKKRNRKASFLKPATAFAAVALLVLGAVFSGLWFSADAYVSIDVNPSVELSINRFGKVIGTYAFNDDGSRVLEETSLRGKNYTVAAQELLTQISDDGYLTDDALVSVTVQSDSGRQPRLIIELRQRIYDTLADLAPTAKTEVIPVTEETRQIAHGCHMSAAKYLAIQELLEVDETATIDEYSDQSISQIRQRTEQCHRMGGNSSGGHGHGHMGRHGN